MIEMKRMRILVLVSAVCLGVFAAGPGLAGEETYLTVKGSDTMVHLASMWAEAFMDHHPGTEVSVTGGGSGTGIAALLNGTTDIACASRTMKEKEYKLAAKQKLSPEEIVVARDGIAVVINPQNPVDVLTLEQIRLIYTGEITNWKDVGGPDQKIVVLSRESSSGTYVFFQEHVLQKQDYTPRARLMPATSAIVQTTGEDAGAIGYVGLGYAAEAGDRIKTLAVKETVDSPAVLPSEETVKSGEYSIARPLHLYTRGESTSLVGDFVAFCLGEMGQEIVRQAGYVKAN
jgi:phosphate transport system substrate-binding protein